MTQRQNLIFDLGGVIMQIRRENAVEAFAAMGMADADAFFDPYQQRGLFGKLEEGAISAGEFRTRVRAQLSRPVTDGEIDRALCRFLIGIPPERLKRLAELRRSGHRVFMLSNTNPIMWQEFILPEFTKSGGDVNSYFDGVVTSFEAKVCKPDERIFSLAQQRFGIKPEESTIFFDDGPANVDAARRHGWQAQQVDDTDRTFMALTDQLLGGQ